MPDRVRARRGLAAIIVAAAALAAGAAQAADWAHLVPPMLHPSPAASTVDVIPEPQSVSVTSNAPQARLLIGDGARVITAPRDDEARGVAAYFADLVGRTRHLRLDLAAAPARGGVPIYFKRTAPGPNPEAYSLEIGSGKIVISAGTTTGLFYGAVTLWQLMTPDEHRGPVALSPMRIDDAPRFQWRGLMLDSARHFQSAAFVERLIDAMAVHKLNVLHWHLTDDQAWRLEIKKYPRLTAVGAWRVPAGAAAQADIDLATGKPRLYGGYYTQDQVREVVAYAAARHISVVPEIEMPGHALSAILAYPELGADGRPSAAIQSDWGVFPYLYNVDDRTFGVLQDVLDEVMDLFPSPYIHVGGDEAVKDQWKASAQIQARMKALGVADEDALQSYFTHRIAAYLDAHGRKLIGWDEILGGGALPAGATVMSWRGIDGAIKAAKMGHDTVLAPAPFLYFDNRQSARPEEPPGRGFVVRLKDVAAFDPAPKALTDDQRRHIIGVQANIWTEHIQTDERVELMAFPRVAALAEAAWSPADRRGWPSFSARLPAMMDRYRALGLKADDAATAVVVTQDTGPAGAQVTLATQFDQGEIRYTTDGAEPDAASPVYAAPLDLPLPTRLQAATFLAGKRIGAVADKTIDAASLRLRASQQLSLCAGALALNLEADAAPGQPRPVMLVDIIKPCWTWPKADLTGVTHITARVGPVPFNYQLGADRAKIVLHPPRTAMGELEVRYDGCEGEPVASLPLSAPGPTGLITVSAALPPRAGAHDLCFTFTARSLDPLWAIDWVRLETPAAVAASAAPPSKSGD
jgi:hexosaminidase